MHGPPSISIPFPPFGKEEPVVLTPPPPEPSALSRACDHAGAVARRHPYMVGGGVAIAVTAGIGYVGLSTGCGPFANVGQEWRLRRKFGDRGVVENGMLKEAIGKLVKCAVSGCCGNQVALQSRTSTAVASAS